MRTNDVQVRHVLLIGLLASLAVPPVVFAVTGLISGLSPFETASALVAQYATSRLNLFIMGALGIIPFGVLGIALVLVRRFSPGTLLSRLALGGGLCIVATMVWAHWTYWRLFLPERVAPMWPHGLELLIGPVFFAPVLALGGLVIGWISERTAASP